MTEPEPRQPAGRVKTGPLWPFPLLLPLILCATFLVRKYQDSKANPLSRIQVPGVGFSLSLEFGTAAVAIQDWETYIPIAGIQGSEDYKAFMRRGHRLSSSAILQQSSSPTTPQSPTCPALTPSSQHVDLTAVKYLLSQLVASVESHLGTKICFVDIALPDPLNQDYQKKILEDAVLELDLRQPTQGSLFYNHAMMAAYAPRKPGGFHYPVQDEQLVVTVGYSREGLNVALLWGEHDVFEMVRQEHSQELGYGLENGTSARSYVQEVRGVLKRVTGPPYGSHPNMESIKLPREITVIVLYGDMARDPAFGDMLRAILGDDLADNAIVVETVYETAMVVARVCAIHVRMPVYMSVKAATACRRRSTLDYSNNLEF